MKPPDQPKIPDSTPNSTGDLKSLPLEEVEKKLSSSADGLTQAEAQKRLTQYGPNEIEEKRPNQFLKFLTYFWDPIPWMIEVAVILSAVDQHWPDFAIILLLLANAVVGFWEEHQAGNAIAELKAKLAIKARVKRDVKWITLKACELVPGDLIRLQLGDKTYIGHESVYGAGMVKFGHCGRPMVYEVKTKPTSSGPKEYRYYWCSRYTSAGHPRVRIHETQLDKQIIEFFRQIKVSDPKIHAWMVKII